MQIVTKQVMWKAAYAGVITLALAAATGSAAKAAPYMVVGLDEKASNDAEGKRVLAPAGRDTVLIVDLAAPEEPRITAKLALENSVAGPPVNLAITPNGKIALVADSNTVLEDHGTLKEIATNKLFVVDLTAGLPRLKQTLVVGSKPSGLSISPTGRLALVACRNDGGVYVLKIADDGVSVVGKLDVGGGVSHVAFAPDGRRAYACKHTANQLAVLHVNGNVVSYDKKDIPTGVSPYNVAVSPDGRLAVTSEGGGEGATGTLSVFDLAGSSPRLADRVAVGRQPEGLAISPLGDIVVSTLIRGSNASVKSPLYHRNGSIKILRRDGEKLTPVKEIEVGGMPEAVVFTPDGKHLLVGNFIDQDFWIFRVEGTNVTDTGKRFKTPGHPASGR